MKAQTYASSDWIRISSGKSRRECRIFLTWDGSAFMILLTRSMTIFFLVDAELLRVDEDTFFSNVMKTALELPKKAVHRGFLAREQKEN